MPVARLSADGEESQVQVREGGSVTFTCRVKANPAAYNVTWFHNVSSERVQVNGLIYDEGSDYRNFYLTPSDYNYVDSGG